MFMMPPQTAAQATMFIGGYSYIIFQLGSNSLIVSGNSASPATVTVFAPQCDDGNWHHLVVTCSASTNGTITVYLDGVNVGATTATGGGSSCMFGGAGSSFFFGQGIYSPNVGSNNYAGYLANIAYYNTVLTGGSLGAAPTSATQVGNHYGLFSTAWNVQYSGQRIASILSVIGWPTALQNIATGVQLVQGATSSLTATQVLSYLQTVSSTELGSLFINQSGVLTYYDRHYAITAPAATISNATLSNRGTDTNVYRYMTDLVPAMDDVDLWNDVPAQRTGGVLQRATSALSIKQYTKRTMTGYTGQLQTNDNDVLAEAQWLLAHYSIPYTRCRQITLSSVTDHGKNLQQMLGRGPLDLITLIWNPIDNSTVYFNQASLIESIQHTVTQEEWVTQWGLAPADTQPYMILNDPIRGQLSTVNNLGF
jgi:hypothetical protein